MIKLLLKLEKRDWLKFFIALFLMFIQVFLDLKVPEYMGAITNIIQKNSGLALLFNVGLKMILFTFMSLVLSFLISFIGTQFAANLSSNIRKDLYKKVQSFNSTELNKFSISSLITRMTNDINQIQTLVMMSMQFLIKAPIMVVLAFGKILTSRFEYSIVTIIALSVIFSTLTIVLFLAIPKYNSLQILIDKLNNISLENIQGQKVIRAFDAFLFQENKFNKDNDLYIKNELFMYRINYVINSIITCVISLLTLGIYYTGAYLMQSASLEEKSIIFGDTIVFISYGVLIVISFSMLAMLAIFVPRGIVSAKRINEVLNTEIELKSGDSYLSKSLASDKKLASYEEQPIIEFKNVSYKYPHSEEYVLHNISFTLNYGQTLGIVGLTGSGKSTLLKLILRFYDVTEGEIIIAGIPVKEWNLEKLNDFIAYVPQLPEIFSESIVENIAINQENTNLIKEDLIVKNLEIAEALSFVNEKEDTIYYKLAKSGKNLSGGQRQRISLARAFYKEANVYLFDDCFSALDYKTDKKIRQNIKENFTDFTKIIVAQRINTIQDADLIMVMEEGKVLAQGKHIDLLASCNLYREIVSFQSDDEDFKDGKR